MQTNLFDETTTAPAALNATHERDAISYTPLDAAIARAEYDVVHGRHRNKDKAAGRLDVLRAVAHLRDRIRRERIAAYNVGTTKAREAHAYLARLEVTINNFDGNN